MNKLIYKTWTFEDDQVKAGSYYLETSLPSASLGINTLEVTVKCSDPTIATFAQNDPVTYFYKGAQRGIYYIQSVERIGPDRYTLTAVSALGLLAQKRHPGGVYTGQTVQEVVTDICGDIPVIIKSNLANIALYGWLPYVAPPKTSAKDNLSQVLFAIGAAVTNDLDGVLRIEPLWSGVSGVLDDDHVCQGGKVTTKPAVTAVSVTEHQYFQGGKSKELFNGSTQAGDIITFDEPAYDLVAEGFTILESGANYAKVSAGSGTLTGNTYIHNTRQVTVEVTPGPVENIKTPSGNPTLVSLVNSYAVAQRLAAYYKCRDTIKVSALIGGNRPGAVVSMYHPYDKKMVKACLAVSDVRMSAVLKSDLEALVGYEPPDIAQQEYYDARVVLTGEGDWDPPEGVENVRYVMFSGAQGGKAGLAGGTSAGSKLHSYSQTSWITGKVTSQGRVTLWGGPGGKGGLGGPGGKGSKILQGTLAVKHGQPIHFNCGIGGHGAEYNVEAAVEGEEGGATTFGALTTDDGSYPSETGWLDVVTGDIFASSGLDGLPGGDGAGAPDDYTIPDNSSNLNEILKYKPATGAVDEDGVEWPGGPTKEKDGQENVAYWQQYDSLSYNGAWAGYALGPGGAVGVTLEESTVRGTNNYAKAFAADGLPGATPTLTPKKAALTIGGRGGYGGGGGSCASWAGAEKDPTGSSVTLGTTEGAPGVGGNGGPGGPGGDGCILLFYRIPKEVKSGTVMDKTGRFVLDRTGRLMVV